MGKELYSNILKGVRQHGMLTGNLLSTQSGLCGQEKTVMLHSPGSKTLLKNNSTCGYTSQSVPEDINGTAFHISILLHLLILETNKGTDGCHSPTQPVLPNTKCSLLMGSSLTASCSVV